MPLFIPSLSLTGVLISGQMVWLPLRLQFPLGTSCPAAGEHSQVGQLVNKSVLTIAQLQLYMSCLRTVQQCWIRSQFKLVTLKRQLNAVNKDSWVIGFAAFVKRALN